MNSIERAREGRAPRRRGRAMIYPPSVGLHKLDADWPESFRARAEAPDTASARPSTFAPIRRGAFLEPKLQVNSDTMQVLQGNFAARMPRLAPQRDRLAVARERGREKEGRDRSCEFRPSSREREGPVFVATFTRNLRKLPS